MAKTGVIGRHRIWREGDVIGMHYEGTITRADVEALRAATGEVLAEVGTCFLLSDMQRCNVIEPEARKFMSDWSREGTDKLTGTAVYGLNFAMRTIVTLAMRAIKFIGKEQVDIAFVKDAAEGTRWIDARRIEVGAVSRAG